MALLHGLWKNVFPSPQKLYLLVILIAIQAFMPRYALCQNLKILQYGAWGLCTTPDPFKNKYPVVAYLPPGTIIFTEETAPLAGYVKVLSQYGHSLMIKEKFQAPGSTNEVSVLTPIAGLLSAPPTNSLIFHKSILCLGQSDRIQTSEKCTQIGDDVSTTQPVGKGWIYTFASSSKGKRWLDLKVVLDEGTREALSARGLDPQEANFDITRAELMNLEKQGLITLLDKKIPPVTFEYQTVKPAFINCGQTKVTEKSLQSSMGIKASAGVSAEMPLWAKVIAGLKAKLGLEVDAESSTAANKTWTISIDTTESSYLYYNVKMIDQSTDEVANILVEKTFECRGSPNIQPGEKIERVVFTIERPNAPDVEEYEFHDSTEYLNVPEPLFGHHPRPIFLSINSPKQHSEVLRKIVEKQTVDVPLAHFMLSHLNNTCSSSKREKCEELVNGTE